MADSNPSEQQPLPTELLLLVFLHGFKGGDDTFAAFPERICGILSASQSTTEVAAVVYPAYDTRGELLTAVDNHVTWLSSLVVEREAAFKARGGVGPVRVVLLGHSMGGLVIADAALALMNATSPWPVVLGIIAYDTPYYGLSPSVFKNTLEKYASHGQSALTAFGLGMGAWSSLVGGGSNSSKPSPPLPSTPASKSKASTSTEVSKPENEGTTSSPSSWLFKSALAVGAAAIVGAAGTAYMKRDEITTSWSWATSHLSFVGELFKGEVLEERMERVGKLREKGVRFHCFYTLLSSTSSTPRTFIIVPRPTPNSPISNYFSSNQNTRASDEVEAHIEMFTDKSDGMWTLGSETCRILNTWLEDDREVRGGKSRGEK